MEENKDRRQEPRYPVAEMYRKYVMCRLYDNGSLRTEATILDLSMNGLRIESPVHWEVDSEINCVISLPRLYPKDLKAKLLVRHARPANGNGTYIIGARIIDADRTYLPRVFTKIIEFVSTRSGDLF